MLKKIQSCVLAAALGLMTIIGSGCAGGRYGPPPAYYILPGLIGAGVGVVSAVAIGSIYSHQADKQMETQRQMMKDQAETQRVSAESNARIQRERERDQSCSSLLERADHVKDPRLKSEAREDYRNRCVNQTWTNW